MSPRRRWAALTVLSASLLVIVMDLTILNVALPELTADLRPSATEQLWIVDVYSLLLAGLLITMSAVADRWGRKRLLLLGFVVFGGASLLVLFASTPLTVLGVGGAMIMPTTLSLIRSIFEDPAERARALGVWAATSGVGVAVGPIVGGLLLEHFSWQAAFLVNVPLMGVALGFGLWLLPEARDPEPGNWDLLGTAGSIAGMVALVWTIKHFAKEGFDDLAAWAGLAVAIGLLTWFVRRCLTREDPLLDVRLLQGAPLAAGAVAALASMFAMAAMLLLIAQWLQTVEGHSPLAPASGCCRWPWARRSGRRWRRPSRRGSATGRCSRAGSSPPRSAWA
jgi:DHA2 family multidrug resistance protein-like MFS transporter